MIVAFKTYFNDEYGYTVGGVFDTWADDKVRYFVCNKMKISDSFNGEEPWRQKVHCIMQCLNMLGMNISSDSDEKLIPSIQTIVIDDYVWLENNEKGFGATLVSAINNRYGQMDVNIVGITKKPHNGKISDCFEISRGNNENSLYVTCINPNFAEHYSFLVANMEGRNGTPMLLESIDKKARKMVERANESNEINLDCSDLDKWAEENLSPKEINRYMMSKPIE